MQKKISTENHLRALKLDTLRFNLSVAGLLSNLFSPSYSDWKRRIFRWKSTPVRLEVQEHVIVLPTFFNIQLLLSFGFRRSREYSSISPFTKSINQSKKLSLIRASYTSYLYWICPGQERKAEGKEDPEAECGWSFRSEGGMSSDGSEGNVYDLSTSLHGESRRPKLPSCSPCDFKERSTDKPPFFCNFRGRSTENP